MISLQTRSSEAITWRTHATGWKAHKLPGGGGVGTKHVPRRNQPPRSATLTHNTSEGVVRDPAWIRAGYGACPTILNPPLVPFYPGPRAVSPSGANAKRHGSNASAVRMARLVWSVSAPGAKVEVGQKVVKLISQFSNSSDRRYKYY